VALVLDTGVLFAALDDSDPEHDVCRRLLEDTDDEQLVIPAGVLVELDYWVRKFATADVWLAFCEDVQDGAYAIYPLDGMILLEAGRLQVKYGDQPLGLVDASVFATCLALGEDKVATLDRRHFAVLQGIDGAALEIVPA
jgi:uncharacterized protein